MIVMSRHLRTWNIAECHQEGAVCPYSWVHVSMRFIYVAAAVGMAIVVLFIAPVVLMGASSAHADTGVNGYLRCTKSDAEPPPQGVRTSLKATLRTRPKASAGFPAPNRK